MVNPYQTAQTQFVERPGGGVPLVFNQHFTGTKDHWDPAVTNGLARDREVLLFNNARSK
jgi:hypothetical protein